jgi:hypothetical protein
MSHRAFHMLERRTILWLVATVGIALVGLILLNGASLWSNQSRPSVVQLDASWAKAYRSFAELKQDADIAVDGSIDRTISVTRDTNGLVYTDFALSIDAVAYNPSKAPVSREIVVHQTGGVIGSTLYEVTDDPLFQSGERVILFLQQYSPGHYFVIGGPTGDLASGVALSIQRQRMALSFRTRPRSLISSP